MVGFLVLRMIHLAVFASGAGSNAQKIIEHFNGSGRQDAQVSLVVCNKAGAGVIGLAEAAGIPVLMLERQRFAQGDGYAGTLKDMGIDFIVLAGFLWKVPLPLIEAYPRRIVNIHPALLPKWGGKGMYGTFVHQAVIAAAELESGITIHYVDEHYDHGDTIFQASCPILPGDTPESLAQKIHLLEHRHYPAVIERVIAGLEPK